MLGVIDELFEEERRQTQAAGTEGARKSGGAT